MTGLARRILHDTLFSDMREQTSSHSPLRLHLGGTTPRGGWKILNIQAGPGVDFVGSVVDLSRFGDGSIAEVYASHVYEHLSYKNEVARAFKEVHRVLARGGVFRIGVPDLEIICRMFLDPKYDARAHYHFMRIIYGGQMDGFDFHKAGFTIGILGAYLRGAGFSSFERVDRFAMFEDCTEVTLDGIPISLNVRAVK